MFSCLCARSSKGKQGKQSTSSDVTTSSSIASYASRDNDYNHSSSHKHKDTPQRKEPKDNEEEDDNDDDGEEEEGGDEDNDEDKEENSFTTADEMIAAYDRTYLALYPDQRLKDVVASHEHLRHWNYSPKTDSYRPKTNHESQWLDVHAHDRESATQKKADTVAKTTSKASSPGVAGSSSLHKMYLSKKSTAPQTTQIKTSPNRGSLKHIAESEEIKSVSPTKKEIMRMLHDTHDPTVQGVRRSFQH